MGINNPELEHVFLNPSTTAPSQSAISLKASWQQIDGAQPEFQVVPAKSWDYRPDRLLIAMESNRIGRPSTFTRALEGLHAKNLVQFPLADGPLRLTPSGVATALALEAGEAGLSDPGFSANLTELLERIERKELGPREALTWLMPLIAPDQDPTAISPPHLEQSARVGGGDRSGQPRLAWRIFDFKIGREL